MFLLVSAALVCALFVPLGGSEPGPSYTVVRGDSLSVIARRESVRVAQLRSWNHIEGDLIEVGQQLVVGPGVEGESWTLAQWLRQRLLPAAGSGETGSPVASAEQAEQDQVPSRLRKKRRRAGRGSSAGAGRAEPRQGDEQQQQAQAAWKALSMPPARLCLAADAGIGEGSFGRSAGLDQEQVSEAMNAFQSQALRCYAGRESADGEVMLQLVVGCDGRVRRSTVRSDSTGAPGFAACVAEVMRHAPFPVHGRDEVELTVPMHFVADISAD